MTSKTEQQLERGKAETLNLWTGDSEAYSLGLPALTSVADCEKVVRVRCLAALMLTYAGAEMGEDTTAIAEWRVRSS